MSPQPEPTPQPTPPPAVVVSVTETQAKLFIYGHESGNNPSKWNDSGCFGLGQNCPARVGTTPPVLLACPSMDYGCEDQWFTNYMLNRYHTWANARAHWLARVPINGKDVGNWW